MNVKKSIRLVHLWLGLSTGIIVFIVAITGCLYAFQEEIKSSTEAYRYVQKENKPQLLPSEIEEMVTEKFPNEHLHAIHYHGAEKAVEAIFFQNEPTEYYFICYVNPYSGKVIATVNQYEGFFHWVLNGHFYLWLPHEIGQTVVATSTLLFVFLILSGFILWYPKNKRVAKQRFWFKWKETTKWKRKNYDLHNITGFYVLSIALIFALTGLVWGFQWFAFSYHKAFGGESSLVYEEPKSEVQVGLQQPINALDSTYLYMRKAYPNVSSIEVHPPETDLSPIAANANVDEDTYWKIDYRYFDQYSMKELQVNHVYGRFDKADIADKVLRMNYDIHTGGILGLPGKIFAFLISLLIASMPITGFLIWWGRKNKN